MKISQTAEYALRAMVWLANHPDAAMTSAQVAEDTRIPAGYLSKVLKTLARHELVVPRRGPGGGFTLARPPEEITALEVIDAIDPFEPIRECPLGYETHRAELCLLHTRLNEALEQITQVFRNTSIRDLLSAVPEGRTLCRGRKDERSKDSESD